MISSLKNTNSVSHVDDLFSNNLDEIYFYCLTGSCILYPRRDVIAIKNIIIKESILFAFGVFIELSSLAIKNWFGV